MVFKVKLYFMIGLFVLFFCFLINGNNLLRIYNSSLVLSSSSISHYNSLSKAQNYISLAGENAKKFILTNNIEFFKKYEFYYLNTKFNLRSARNNMDDFDHFHFVENIEVLISQYNLIFFGFAKLVEERNLIINEYLNDNASLMIGLISTLASKENEQKDSVLIYHLSRIKKVLLYAHQNHHSDNLEVLEAIVKKMDTELPQLLDKINPYISSDIRDKWLMNFSKASQAYTRRLKQSNRLAVKKEKLASETLNQINSQLEDAISLLKKSYMKNIEVKDSVQKAQIFVVKPI